MSSGPVRAAWLKIEEIIDPRKTRSLLCDFARLAAPVLTPGKVSFKIRP